MVNKELKDIAFELREIKEVLQAINSKLQPEFEAM